MKHFAILCLGVALLAACRKDDVIVCEPATAATFADLKAAAPAVQTFTFDLAQAQSIRASGGATVAFGANAYILPNGNVATGQAQLRLREIYTVPDMILTNMPTTAAYSRQVLVSGGEFNIQVWQGTARLRLAPVSATGVVQRLTLISPVPTAGLDTTRMLLWQQPTPNASAVVIRDSSGWLLATNPNSTAAIVPIRVPSTAGYHTAALPLDSISNWNIDQLWHAYQNKPSGTIGVEVPGITAVVTRVFIRPVGFNGTARGFLNYSSTTRWNFLLPYGADVVIVVLQERGGQLYYGTQRLTTAANTVVTPTLEALSAAEIVRRIRLL